MITFTTTTTNCPRPLYEFWMLPPGTTNWILGQGYSTNPSWRWNSTGAPPGDYQFSAWVQDAYSGSAISTGLGTYDGFLGVADTISAAPCSAPAVTASPASPTTSGTPVAITASSTCAHANPAYEFWMRAAGTSTWQLVQPYSSNATYNWNSTGALAGTEYFGVWVRDASSDGVNRSSMGRYDAVGSIPYSIVTASCASVSATAAPTSLVRGSGTHVTITGAASGCTSANPRYEFWMRAASQNAWQLVQGYTTSATYDWNSTGAAAGTIYFGVWVKDASSPTSTLDANASTTVTVS